MPKDSYMKSIVNAIPSPVFVVDSMVYIKYFNLAASRMLGDKSELFQKKRSGEVLHCINGMASIKGGNTNFCINCDIRTSVNNALDGNNVYRLRTELQVSRDGASKNSYFLISASPIYINGNVHVLLILEDINELTALKGVIPICSSCKSIRNDSNYWQQLEEYMDEFMNIQFSHGVCPKCSKALYPQLHS